MPGRKGAKKIAVLGAGRVGATIALDLARTHEVGVVDGNPQALARLKHKNIRSYQGDLTRQKTLASLIRNCDLVINALAGHLGFGVLKEIIRCRKPVVDISFFPEDAFELAALAKEKKVTAVVD